MIISLYHLPRNRMHLLTICVTDNFLTVYDDETTTLFSPSKLAIILQFTSFGRPFRYF